MKKSFVVLLAFASFYSMAGKYRPIYNTSFEVTEDLGKKDVESAIKKALIRRGWTIKETKNGHIAAKIHVRSHRAEIAIAYSKKEISITYVDSANLGYRNKKGEELIHGNYNRWIANLERTIQDQLLE